MSVTYGVVILDDLVEHKASEHCCHADGDVLQASEQCQKKRWGQQVDLQAGILQALPA